MSTHLSARLAWHDRGWDGRICDAPHLNAHCIVHQHIRDGRNDILERSAAGVRLTDLDNWQPPCSRDIAAYSPHGFVIKHNDPLDFRRLPSKEERIPPYSCCTAPYRWMLEEFFQEVCEAEDLSIPGPSGDGYNAWVTEPDRQLKLLDHFWQKLDQGKSLVFYYVNQGNPLDEAASRMLVGVGRIKRIEPQKYFDSTHKFPVQIPIWSRCITQDYPKQGVRIPYQEYIRLGLPADEIACRIPKNAILPFSYGGEHVTDDVAVAILERVIQCIERVSRDDKVSGDWERNLAWLDEALADAWQDRGPFPGIGSMLQYLGCTNGMAFQRSVLAPMAKAGKSPWDYTLSILNGISKPEPGPYSTGLDKAREKWIVLEDRRNLLSKLVRFELSQEQIRRVADPDRRQKCGIDSSIDEIVANPYVVCERDIGTANSDPVALETIDHGLRPEGNAKLFPDDDNFASDDRRRIRAVGVAMLKEAATLGDTVLELTDFLQRIRERFPDKRVCDPDLEIVLAESAFYKEALWTDFDSDSKVVALSHLRSLETRTAEIIKRRAKRTNTEDESTINWLLALENEFKKPETERERLALEEKAIALQKLFSRRLCVLNGGAGVGKTSVLKVFLNELDKSIGRQSFLLLAPTGKARVRLSTKTERNAMTIHQFLLKQGWLTPDIFALREKSMRSPHPVTTVVIDECSMIPTDLFGTLFRALDMGPLRRLILVGDPNQLPPIGPGRPFADTIEWLERKYPDCIATLNIGMRVNEDDEPDAESTALTLAGGYRSTVLNPGDDEILATVAQGKSAGDLNVVYWEDHDHLYERLKDLMGSLLNIEDDYHSFNSSLGITESDWKRSEDWQILSPTRAQHFGTTDLNRLIQSVYRRGLIAKSQNPNSKFPRAFGDEEIVWTDKVIQTINKRKNCWPRDDSALNYVANGEIGIVKNTKSGNTGDHASVEFSTQPEVSYTYYRQEVKTELELAYAITVHRAQGSDFGTVFLIIPQNASSLSRELIYTGLTRFRSKLVLLIEKNIEPLLRLRRPEYSDTNTRNSNMFKLSLRPDGVSALYLGALIHRTRNGTAVRSKSEVVVADILEALEISYQYEQPLYSRADPRDFRLPDFTVSFEGDVYYWEHLGMLNLPNYRTAWERKLKWYRDNNFDRQLIVSQDSPNGGINAAEIEQLARQNILGN